MTALANVTPPVVIVAAPLAAHPLIEFLFPHAEVILLAPADLRPQTPFRGRLHELFSAWKGQGQSQGQGQSHGQGQSQGQGRPIDRTVTLCGLVVPARWLGSPPAPIAFTVADHVNLELRGPLAGAWPAAVPRTFPCMTGIYQPAAVRSDGDPHVYSAVTVAGVRDLMSFTPFEHQAVAAGGFAAACDCLVPAVILAAHNSVSVAACCIVA